MARLIHILPSPDSTRCAHCAKPKSRSDVGLCLDCYHLGYRVRKVDVFSETTRWFVLESGVRVRWRGDVLSSRDHIDVVLRREVERITI